MLRHGATPSTTPAASPTRIVAPAPSSSSPTSRSCSRRSTAGARLERVYELHAGARSRSSRSRRSSRPGSRSRWRRRRRSTTSTSRCRPSRRSSASRTSSRTSSTELEEKLKAKKMSEEAPGQGREGAQEAQDDVADERRGHGRPQLHRLGRSRCRGTRRPRTSSTSSRPRRSSTRTTTGCRRSRSASSSTSRCRQLVDQLQGPDPLPRRAARRRQDLARPLDRARHRTASSCASRSAACATRPRSAGTAAPTSARCPARSSSR